MIGDDPRWPVDFLIYAYVAADGEVLYVGQTCDQRTRRTAHRVRATWWAEDLEWALVDIAADRPAARLAERKAIRELAPVHNVQHNPHGAAA